jgi:uncharacterized membrane-anchored protein
MDRRAKLQLRLQQTVEGLSLVVLTYYGVGLVTALAKGLKDVGLPMSPDVVSAMSIPIIAGALALGIRRARKKLTGEVAPDQPKRP